MNLALKYRPQDFKDVVGQDNIVNILQNQLLNNSIKQAYLFTGPAGDGKTTTARLLAKSLNKGTSNVIEIDAASNNGVDNIRDLRESVQFKPMGTPYKIYIIDEVHMLSTGAFNALLKTLEEPPIHAIFILCTTDPQKIPATILSRCQRFDFKRMTVENIVERLRYIVKMEDYEAGERTGNVNGDLVVTDEALEYIAKAANGGMRNAISMLDTCLGYKAELDVNDIVEILGTVNHHVMFELTDHVIAKDEAEIINTIESIYSSGSDLKTFLTYYTEFLVDLRKYQVLKDMKYIKISSSFEKGLEHMKNKEIRPLLKSMMELTGKVKYEANVKPFIIGELIILCL
jgi:DNA polymerase III subunit gamma/tau